MNSGASTLLICEAIKLSQANKLQKFDFEGSMIEGVANSFKQFGAIQTPYFRITKANNPLIKIVEAFR
jgi:hypothetical protein